MKKETSFSKKLFLNKQVVSRLNNQGQMSKADSITHDSAITVDPPTDSLIAESIVIDSVYVS